MRAKSIDIPFEMPVQGQGPKLDKSLGFESYSRAAVERHAEAMLQFWREQKQLPMQNWTVLEIVRSAAQELRTHVATFAEAEPDRALGLVSPLREGCSTLRGAIPYMRAIVGWKAVEREGEILNDFDRTVERLDATLSVLDGSLRPSIQDWIVIKKEAAEVRTYLMHFQHAN